jgi:hypothetical protein
MPDHSSDTTLRECPACNLQFDSHLTLRHHRSAKHSALSFRSDSKEYVVNPEENGYACPLGSCSQSYRSRDGLQRHLRKHHGVKFSGGVTCAQDPSTPPSHFVEGLLAATKATQPSEARLLSTSTTIGVSLTVLTSEKKRDCVCSTFHVAPQRVNIVYRWCFWRTTSG